MFCGEAEHHLGLERALDVEVELDLGEAADQEVAGGVDRGHGGLPYYLPLVGDVGTVANPHDRRRDSRVPSDADCADPDYDPVPAVARELGLPPGGGRGGGRAARRGQHGAVHRALPQGAHRRARRGPDPRDRGAADLPGRARGPAGGDPGVGGRAGQAHARARGQAARGARQVGARGPLRAVPAAPQDPGLGRARARARAAGAADPRAGRRRRPGRRGGGVRRRGRWRAPTTRSPARATSSPRCSPTPPRSARSSAASTPSTASWSSQVVPGKGDEPTKFEQYYQFQEAVKSIPSHRFLAIRRGEAEGVLRAHVAVDTARVEAGILRLRQARRRLAVGGAAPAGGRPTRSSGCSRRASRTTCAPSSSSARTAAAVDIFAGNLRNLLLAAPLGSAAVIGVDPGLRTGCKCAAIDATGKFLGTVTVYITQGDAQLARAKDDVRRVRAAVRAARDRGRQRHRRPRGGGVRQADARRVGRAPARGGLAASRRAVRRPGQRGRRERVLGARPRARGVPRARSHDPRRDLDRPPAPGSARRAGQDRPKSIGVGQYQHDVHQPLLAKKLGDVVEELRQPRRRRAQHRERAAARLRRRHRQGAGEEDRRCTATATARSRRAGSCWTSRGSGPRRSSRRRASCGSPARRTRSIASRGPPRALSAGRADRRAISGSSCPS